MNKPQLLTWKLWSKRRERAAYLRGWKACQKKHLKDFKKAMEIRIEESGLEHRA